MFKVEYLGRIEYDFQKSRVTGPWDQKVSVSAKKILQKFSCLFTFKPILSSSFLRQPTELILLVDFKAIYPGVPPGIFASFPGVAHFLSFEEICQYPRVPQGKVATPWETLGYFPGVDPREIKIPGVYLTFLKHLRSQTF
jgi:hypothetical protein